MSAERRADRARRARYPRLDSAWSPISVLLASLLCTAAAGAAPPEVTFRGIAIPDRAGRVLTVAGPVDPATLGLTLPHEHLFIDLAAPLGTQLPGPATDEDRRRFDAPFATSEASALLPRAFTANRDALVLDDLEIAIDELRLFREAGGGTLVNVTTSVGRDPPGLLEASRRAGVNVVMGTGYYRAAWHPPDLSTRSIDDLVEHMVREIVAGDAVAGVRAGIIGEIAAEDLRFAPDSDEVRVLRAAARASQLTGAALTLHSHIGRPEKWHAALDVLEAEGTDLSRVAVGHVTGVDVAFIESLLRRGVYVQLDTLGAPFFTTIPALDTRPNLEAIFELVRRGHARRLLVSQDVCTKFQLRRHGGAGYTYVALHLLPYLRGRGVAEHTLRQIVERNPADLLTFRPPTALSPSRAPAPR